MLDHSGSGSFVEHIAQPPGGKFEMARLISQALSDEGGSRRPAPGAPDMNGMDFSVSANVVSLPD